CPGGRDGDLQRQSGDAERHVAADPARLAERTCWKLHAHRDRAGCRRQGAHAGAAGEGAVGVKVDARARIVGAVATLVVALCSGPTALAQPAPPAPLPPQTVTASLGVDPNQPGTTPHWTITIGAPYCGGYRIGDGVYVSAEAPLAMPSTPPDGSVL